MIKNGRKLLEVRLGCCYGHGGNLESLPPPGLFSGVTWGAAPSVGMVLMDQIQLIFALVLFFS